MLNKKNVLACLAAGLLLISTLPACAQTLVREVAGISEYKLDNGLQVLLMPVAGAGRTYVTVTYKVGSRMEGPQETGMAHLLEHVTFRGVQDEAGQMVDLGAEIKKLAVTSFNATTSEDRTSYLENFGANPAMLARLLELEALRMRSARLAQADFEKEKPIVLNEMGIRGESLEGQMFEGLASGVFRSHPYGRPVIGYPKDIEQLSLATLRHFYETWYRPDNAVLMIAGEFDPAATLALVQRSFGKIEQSGAPLPEAPPAEPAQTGPRRVTLRTASSAVGVAYRVPGMAHRDAAAVKVMTAFLPVVPTNFIPNEGDAGVPTTHQLASHDPGYVVLVQPMPRARTDDTRARAALEKRAERWVETLELDNLSGYSRSIELTAEHMQSQLRLALRNPAGASALISEAVGAGDWRLVLRLLDDLGRLAPADVMHAYNAYVIPENRTLALGVTDPAVTALELEQQKVGGFAGLFSKPAKVDTVKDAGATVGALDTAGAAVGSTGGAAFELDPAKLDRDVRRLLLPSGITLDMLDRKTADGRVYLTLQLRFGNAPAQAADPGWRGLTQPMLEVGIEDAGQRLYLRYSEIQNVKAKGQFSYNIQGGPQHLLVVLTAPSESLPAAVALLRGLLLGPVLDREVFQSLKAQTIRQFTDQLHEPDWAPELARQHRMKAQGLSLNQAGYEPSERELIEIWNKLDVKAVRGFWQRSWSANDARFSVVGAVPESLPAIIESLFGDWKKPQAPAYERFEARFKPEPAARFVSLATAGKGGAAQTTARIALQQDFPLNERDPEALPLTLGLRILAAPGINGSRLTDRLRGRDAISYAVDYMLHLPRFGDAANVLIFAAAAPGQAARAEAAMQEEVARLLEQGITAAELEAAKHEVRTGRSDLLRNDAALASLLLSQADRDEGFATTAAREDVAINAATVESVNAALRKFLLPDRWVIVVTGAASEKAEKAGAQEKR